MSTDEEYRFRGATRPAAGRCAPADAARAHRRNPPDPDAVLKAGLELALVLVDAARAAELAR